MIRPYETIPIPEVSGDQIDAQLSDLTSLVRPGFIVRADSDIGGEWRNISDILTDHPVTFLDTDPSELGDHAWGWHIDGVSHEKPVLELTVHRTVTGIGHVALLTPKPDLWELRRLTGHRGLGLPKEFVALLNDEKVDENLTETTVHTSQIYPGDFVVFTTNGPQPTVHNFTTLEAPRSSELRLAKITIT